MREMEAMIKMAELGEVFTGTEAREALNMKKGAFYYHIRRLERDGIIERIGRNRYRLGLHSQGASDSFVLASVMVPESAVGYWSALNYYGMTEQIPRLTYVLTTIRRNYRNLESRGIKAVIIRKKKFFGFRVLRIAGRTVRITDPEKTVADCLDRPRNCGGIIEVAKALRLGVDVETVAENLRKMGSNAGLKRLGYLGEILGFEISGLNEEINEMKGYSLLDPTLGRKGRWNGKWRLIVNIPEGYLEEESEYDR